MTFLQELYSKNVTDTANALSLFRKKTTKEQEDILNFFEKNINDGVLEYAPRHLKNVGPNESPEHHLNLGLILHLIANSIDIGSAKAIRLWLKRPLSRELIDIFISSTCKVAVQLSIPKKKGSYNVNLPNFLDELGNFHKDAKLALEHLPLLGEVPATSKRVLELYGTPNLTKPKISELLIEHGRHEWSNWYCESRSMISIDVEDFEEIHITEDSLLTSLSIQSRSLQRLFLNDITSLSSITVNASTMKKCDIKGCKNILELKVVDHSLSSLSVERPILSGIADAVHIDEPEKISRFLQDLLDDLIIVESGLTRKLHFKDQWAFLNKYDEGRPYLEYDRTYFSVKKLIEAIKADSAELFQSSSFSEIILYEDVVIDLDWISTVTSSYTLDNETFMSLGDGTHGVYTGEEVRSERNSNIHQLSEQEMQSLTQKLTKICDFYGENGQIAQLIQLLRPSEINELKHLKII